VNDAETFLLVRSPHCAGCDSSTSNRWWPLRSSRPFVAKASRARF